jgi:uncharacterized membrane protein YgcG
MSGIFKGGLASDPKGLVYECYRIDGIGMAECRSIFLDWALSLPPDTEMRPHLVLLMDEYGTRHPGHPMTAVLREGLDRVAARPVRRGGHSGGRARRVAGPGTDGGSGGGGGATG